MKMPSCDICRGSGKINLPIHHDWRVEPEACEMSPAIMVAHKTFDCPQCVPTVPYRRVRAARLVSEHDLAQGQKFQMPIQRQLASQFGTYLMREGLLQFSVDMTTEPGRCRVRAEIGVVTPANVEKSGATTEGNEANEVAISKKLQRQLRERGLTISLGGDVAPMPVSAFKPLRSRSARIREDREALESGRDRFSGLELDEFKED